MGRNQPVWVVQGKVFQSNETACANTQRKETAIYK